jgi:hypothetical protein
MNDRQLTVKQMILQKIESKEYTVKQLAPIAGFVEKYAQNYKRALAEDREIDFQGFVNVVEHIWGDKVVEYMSQCANEVDPNKKCARNLLEYLCINRSLDALGLLISRMENCSNKESKEWSRVYSIQYYCQVNSPNINFDDIIQQAKTYKTNIVELKVFLKLIKSYCYQRKSKYHMNSVMAEEIKYYLDEIESGYIKDMYTFRLSEVMSMITLRVFNQPEVARTYIDSIIPSQIKNFNAFGYFQKGYSYLFASYENAHKYLNESLEIYKTLDREWIVKDLEEKVEFVNVYWDKLEKPECKYHINYFLMNIKRGVNIDKPLSEYKDKLDESMYLYLKGYNDKNYPLLIESALLFVRKGDAFLANLPREALLEMGYDKIHLVDLVMNIREN